MLQILYVLIEGDVCEEIGRKGQSGRKYLRIINGKTQTQKKYNIDVLRSVSCHQLRLFLKLCTLYFLSPDCRVTIALLFDATVRNIVNLNFSIFMTFTISVALEFPADICAIYGLDLIGRRWSAVISMTMAGLTTLVTVACFSGAYFI